MDTVPTLVTERLRLRAWNAEDLPRFAQMNANRRVMEFFSSLLTREESDAMVGRITTHWQEHGFGLWAIEVIGESSLAGFVGLAVPRFQARFTPCVEIGWRLTVEHWGHGYATEGARAALAFGFEQHGLDEIVSFTAAINQRSLRVMERIGLRRNPADDFDHPMLTYGHPLRPHVLYRLTRSDWAHDAPLGERRATQGASWV